MKRVLIALGVCFLVLVCVLAALLQSVGSGVNLPLEVFKALMSLATAVLVTGVLSFLLSQYATQQSRRSERGAIVSAALQELKSGYERIAVARFFLGADPSGRTYQEQIAGMSEARGRLHRVQRERFIIDTDVDTYVQNMLDYLTEVADEYKAHHVRILVDSLVAERRCKEFLESATADEIDLPKLSAHEFPRLFAMLDETRWHQDAFYENYRSAKNALQEQLSQAGVRGQREATSSVTDV